MSGDELNFQEGYDGLPQGGKITVEYDVSTAGDYTQLAAFDIVMGIHNRVKVIFVASHDQRRAFDFR